MSSYLFTDKLLVFIATSVQSISIESEILDSNPWLFNTLNYTLDLSSGEPEPRKHNQLDYITKISHVNYDPEAKCPKWEKFLNEIFDSNEELIVFVQRAVGYSLTGDISAQCLFFLHGTGRNGKSLFTKTIEMLMGDYTYKAPNEMIMMQRYSQIPSDVAKLKGKRFVLTSEIEENRWLAESRVKDLTGGDKIPARVMYGDWFEFEPSHKLWIYGNHKPVIRGDDTGIWRRMKLIPFSVEIPEEDQIPIYQMLDMFKGELNGIWIFSDSSLMNAAKKIHMPV